MQYIRCQGFFSPSTPIYFPSRLLAATREKSEKNGGHPLMWYLGHHYKGRNATEQSIHKNAQKATATKA